jgi:hypothetical protein
MRGAVTRRRGTLLALVVCAGMALLSLASAAPAGAFVNWAHDGIPEGDTADTCVWCHANGVTNESCTSFCHRGFKVTPGATVDGRFAQTCWSCHAPGADTSGFASSSSACSQECHLYTPISWDYAVAYGHGTAPHLGASAPYGQCLDCHATSPGPADPGDSPHHDGVSTPTPACVDCHNGVVAGEQQSHDGVECESCHEGMNLPAVPAACTTCHVAATFGAQDCRTCHAAQIHDPAPGVGTCTSCHDEGYQKHAGALECTSCHTDPEAFHHGTAPPAVKSCRGCHAMKHAGAKVPGARCADCHKGSAPPAKPRAQHSSTVTQKLVCSGCHGKKLHAKAVGAKTTCRTCHKGKYHAAQPKVSTATCLKCHPSAKGHSGGLRCVLCHKSAVHDPTPSP